MIIVTGGAGFIGSHIVDSLVMQNLECVVIDDLSTGFIENLMPGVPLLELNLAYSYLGQLAKEDDVTIIHCAAQVSVEKSYMNPISDAQTNIVGTLRLIKSFTKIKHFIYLTTAGALYGEPMGNPWTEKSKTSPASPYGISKLVVEQYLKILLPKVTILRLSNVYGPRQSAETAVVSTFIDRMHKNLPVTIDGNGKQSRDLIYVEDVVDAVNAALEKGVTGTFNISTGISTSINALFRELALLTDYKQEPDYGPARRGDVNLSVISPKVAQAALEWRARVPLREGLSRMLGERLERPVEPRKSLRAI